MNTLRTRLEGFVDGVLAIAVTLLAIELPVPSLVTNPASFFTYLPDILAFILGFITIALFWVNHHRLSQHLTEFPSRRIVWMTMVFLFFETIIPFATKTLLLNDFHHLSLLMYSIVLLGASISFSLLHYITHKAAGSDIVITRIIVGPLSYIAACVSVFLSPVLVFLFLIIPPFYYFVPRPTPQKKKKIRKVKK